MANLENIRALNTRYGKSSPILETKNFSYNITENFDLNKRYDRDKLEKAMSSSIALLGPKYISYFDLGLPSSVALLFVDVCNFSTRFEHFTGEEIGQFFDEYYDLVIPIIYKHNGEIDKIMGDGIICSFGPPFLDKKFSDCISSAVYCSMEIIEATIGTKFASKIALHAGEINYFKNKSGFYNEYTMIGKPLTELYRLESISEDEAINTYGNTDLEQHFIIIVAVHEELDKHFPNLMHTRWRYETKQINSLKGVLHQKHFVVQKK